MKLIWLFFILNKQFWSMPKEWRDKFVEQKEERDNHVAIQTQNMLKMKEQMKKVDIDSDEDDLAGWHKK